MRGILLIVLLSLGIGDASAQSFEKTRLAGLWAESIDTSEACSQNNLKFRYELSDDGKTLLFKLDREWQIATGKKVTQYSASVVRQTLHALIIRYNSDVGESAPNYPREWEMSFVAPGLYRWRATDWPPDKVNTVVGYRCAQ